MQQVIREYIFIEDPPRVEELDLYISKGNHMGETVGKGHS